MKTKYPSRTLLFGSVPNDVVVVCYHWSTWPPAGLICAFIFLFTWCLQVSAHVLSATKTFQNNTTTVASSTLVLKTLEEHTTSVEREERACLDLAQKCRAKRNHFLLPEWGDKELPKDQWRLWCVNHLESFIYSSESRWGAAGRLTAPVSELSRHL